MARVCCHGTITYYLFSKGCLCSFHCPLGRSVLCRYVSSFLLWNPDYSFTCRLLNSTKPASKRSRVTFQQGTGIY